MTVAVTQAGPVARAITNTRAGRALASRFVAGETLNDAAEVAKSLNGQGLLVSLDHLGEEVDDEATVIRATDEYLECLDRIAADGLEANISVKPTQLGLAIDEDLALRCIDRLAEKAAEVRTTVTIDMEDSRYTDATVRLYEKAQSAHGNLGMALQAYLYRTPEDLERLMPLGGHIRLCKGAYVEPGDIAFTSKADVDSAFASLLETLMASPDTKPAIATHDPKLVDLARELAAGREGPMEFQMLYGVRPDLQRRLADEGYEMRIYVPFGSQWYPYLTRRLAERPANAWFFAKALIPR
ncbi:MAG: proline dehydrogenase family protein [Acidimicrobiia bacterium]